MYFEEYCVLRGDFVEGEYCGLEKILWGGRKWYRKKISGGRWNFKVVNEVRKVKILFGGRQCYWEANGLEEMYVWEGCRRVTKLEVLIKFNYSLIMH